MFFSRLRSLGEGLTRLGALVAGYGALGLSLLITFEVLSRKLFNYSTLAVVEVGGYVMATGVALSFAYALVQRAHTRVDVFLAMLPAALRAPLNALAAVALAAMAVFMAWRGLGTLLESIHYQSHASTPLGTPLWIPQSIWVAGLGLFALLAAAQAVTAVVLLARGRAAVVNREFGPRSTDEEIDEARHDIEDRQPSGAELRRRQA